MMRLISVSQFIICLKTGMIVRNDQTRKEDVLIKSLPKYWSVLAVLYLTNKKVLV